MSPCPIEEASVRATDPTERPVSRPEHTASRRRSPAEPERHEVRRRDGDRHGASRFDALLHALEGEQTHGARWHGRPVAGGPGQPIVAAHGAHHQAAEVVSREAERRPSPLRPGEVDATLLAPFQPLPPALIAPPVAGAPPPAAGSALAHAEAAALAERLVTSLRIGRTGTDGRVVHMKLATAHAGGVEVRLVEERGRLTAELRADPGCREEAERIAGRLQVDLGARGLALDALDVV